MVDADTVDVPTLHDLLSPPSLSPTAKVYLNRLPNLPLTSLIAEPTTLTTQSHTLTSSLTNLTQTAYPTFLSLHKTTNALSTALDSFSTSLDALIDTSLPGLEAAAAGWKDRTDGVLNERKKARIVLDQHEKIRDLLDIPLLIDTCVRNGYFTEALSLAERARSLSQATADTTDNALLVKSVLAEVQHSISQMLLTLLVTLREPNRKLPALSKAVTFLRKMDVFSMPLITGQPSEHDQVGRVVSSEELIAISFLSGRQAVLASSLDSPAQDIQRLTVVATSSRLREREQEDLARNLKRYVDLWREAVSDIVSQYNHIFLEHKTGLGPSLKSPISPQFSTFSASTAAAATPSDPPSEPPTETLRSFITAFYSFTLHTHLLPFLRTSLSLLQPSSLPPLLTQLTYCSTAFSKVGGDFRSILADLFTNAVVISIGTELGDALEKWMDKLQDARSPLVPGNTSVHRIKKMPSTWLVSTGNPSGSAILGTQNKASLTTDAGVLRTAVGALKTSTNPAHVPPTLLTQFPPLAVFTNSLLTVLNSLRLLAPVSTMDRLEAVMDEVVVRGGKSLNEYLRAVVRSGKAFEDGGILTVGGDKEKEKEKWVKEVEVGKCVGIAYWDVFVPYMRRALIEGVFGEEYEGEEDEEEDGEEKDKGEDGDASEESTSEVGENDVKAARKEWEELLQDVLVAK